MFKLIFIILPLVKNEQIKVLIVDDEVLIIETIRELLSELNISNVTFSTTKEDALRKIENIAFDLILLDIRMKGNYDGIEIGKFITKLDIPFLYITAHSDQDMMARMLETNIKGFISKPIRRDQFLMNIKIVINQINLKPLNSIRLLTNRGYVTIVVDDIYFVKSIGNNLEINLENSQYVIRNTIASFLAELCLENFVQNHRSYIVNLNKVEISTAKELILKNKVCIPISRTYSQHFKS